MSQTGLRLYPQNARDRPPFRADIEGLRAVAVLAVMGFHFGVPWLHGGFVGVDIFFVISGYLITGILVTELKETNHIELQRFYGRRARRLLPALLLVTLVTLACGIIILAPTELYSTARAALASSLYVSNFWFLRQIFDYFAPETARNPFLHTWTLSVEEQFYLLWPALLLMASRAKWQPRGITAAIAATSIVSFIICIWLTYTNGAWAFYATPARAWEFGFGALASLAPVMPWIRNAKTAAGIGWLGIILVFVSFIAIDEDTSFPGLISLLPVSATVCVLVSGASGSPQGPVRLLRTAPFQWFGRLSYSIYLWHWPIIVYATIIHPSLSVWGRLACAALTLSCGAASYRLLEHPVRSNLWLAARGIRSIGMGAALSVLGAIAASGSAVFVYWLAASPAQATISAVTSEPSAATARGCLANFTDPAPHACVFGKASSSKTFVLFGDSHADAWSTPFASLAEQEGWRMVTYLKSSCPAADIRSFSIRLHRVLTECVSWREQVIDKIIALRPSGVIIVEFSSGYIRGPLSRLGEHAVDLADWSAGLTRSLRRFYSAGIPVILVRDNPTPRRNIQYCLSQAVWRGLPESNCATPRTFGLNAEVTNTERAIADSVPGVQFVDLSLNFCDQSTCPAVRDGLIVYRDENHLTSKFAMTLTGSLEAVLLPIMGPRAAAGASGHP